MRFDPAGSRQQEYFTEPAGVSFFHLFSMFSGIFGLLVSYFINAATGPVIVIFASVIYFITYSYGSRIQ